jgi:hypothetical protein
MEGDPQSSPARRDDSSMGCFPGTPIVKLQRRLYWLRGLKKFALNPEITERAEIRTHGFAAVKEGSELALQLQQKSAVARIVTHFVTGDEQAQVERELLDGVTNLVEPLLANRVLRRPIRGASATDHSFEPPAHV